MNDKGAPQSRTSWIDAARGIGIILVVVAHVERGLIEAGLMPAAPAYLIADDAIYSFHMPVFFFIAGLFVAHGLKAGAAPFLGDKLKTIIWPYFLWSFLHVATVVVVGRDVNAPLDWHDLAAILWRPIAQYWFLYALFLCHLAIVLLWPRRTLLIIAALLGAIVSTIFGISNIILHALQEIPFVIAGLLLGPWLLAHVSRIRAFAPVLMVSAWMLFAAAFVVKSYCITNSHFLAITGYVAACAGIVGTLMAAMLVADRSPWLCRIGQASMAIFVAHTFFSAGLRIGTQRLGLSVDPLLLLPVASAIGIGGPLLLYRWSGRHGISTLLGLGKYVRA